MSRDYTPILTAPSSEYPEHGHGSLLKYFLSDKFEDIPDLPRLCQTTPLPIDLSPRSPFDLLPNEILSYIFELGYFGEENLNLRYRALIVQISRRWQKIAHHTPSLWSNYRLSQGNINQLIDALPLSLKRSGDYLLDIDLNCFWDTSRTKEVMEQFLPHSRRWRALSITTPGADVFRYLRHISAPQLQTFQVCHFSSERLLLTDPDLFDHHLPSLRHLTLRNVSLRATALPLKSLCSLNIRGYGVWPDQEMLGGLIGGSTALHHMTLHVEPENISGNISPHGDNPIILPCLRTLDFVTSEGLSPYLATLSRLFSCPSLDTLTVKGSTISATASTHDIVRYSRASSDTCRDSPSLHIKEGDLYLAWHSLNFSRNIVTLELNDVRWPHWSNCTTVFAELPLLQTMAITNVNATTALSELGRPPRPIRVPSLKKLEVSNSRHERNVVGSDFAQFVSTFEIPQLHSLALHGISWQQWKFLILLFVEKAKGFPDLNSLTLTNLGDLTHSLPDPTSAFPNLQNLTLIRTAAEPFLEHLTDNPVVSWPNLKSLAICGDLRANTSLLCRIITSRPKQPLSLALDIHFQSDRESWNWLKDHAGEILMQTVES